MAQGVAQELACSSHGASYEHKQLRMLYNDIYCLILLLLNKYKAKSAKQIKGKLHKKHSVYI